MRVIVPISGGETVLDEEDLPLMGSLTWRAWRSRKRFYAVAWNGRDENGKQILVLLHRIILNVPKGICIDHWDRNGLHNWRENLRVATNSQNQANKPKLGGCTSSFKGVHWSKKSRLWRGGIEFHGKRIHLGFFRSETDAAAAYDRKAIALFGEFALLNFPEGAAA